MNDYSKIILSVVFVFASSFAGSYVLVSYVPIKYFPDPVKKIFGSTITTILGTDTISGSRTTINTNFSNLNTDKIEATVTNLASLTSAAALATVGTIISGTWHGGIVFPTWGGTGSSTLSSNQVILGNGTGALNVVSGFGTSGQFLTSNGAGVAPSFQSASVDQTQNYTWTGLHVFKGGVVINNASSTISGQLLITATTTFNGGTSGIVDYQVFTSSGSWTVTNIVANDLVRVMCWGQGGGGGGTASASVGAGGGGGGGFTETQFRVSDLTLPVTVTIGTTANGATAGNNNGTSGTDSTFGTYLTAAGGAFGSQGTVKTGGTGGASQLGLGSQIYAGGTAAQSSTFGGGGGGTGESSAGAAAWFGGAGGGGGDVIPAGHAGGGAKTGYGGAGGTGGHNGTVATDGSAPGGGGGGGGSNGDGAKAGGNGGRGECRVWTMRGI